MYKVLLVEDSDLIRGDLADSLEWEKHNCTIVAQAGNGKRGLEFYLQHRPDIIITDIKMPVLSGLEMIEKILAIDPEAQFILLTAYEEFDFAKRAIQLGVNSYILKHELCPELMLAEIRKIQGRLEANSEFQFLSRAQSLKQYFSVGGQPQAPFPAAEWRGATAVFAVESCAAGERLPVLSHNQWKRLHLDLLSAFRTDGFGTDEGRYLALLQIAEPFSERKNREDCQTFAQALLDAVRSITGMAVRAAVAPLCREPLLLRDSCVKANAAADLFRLQPGARFIDSELAIPPAGSEQSVRTCLARLKAEVSDQRFGAAKATLHIIFSELLPASFSLPLFEESLQTIQQQLAHMKIPVDHMSPPPLDVRAAETHYTDLLARLENQAVIQYGRYVQEMVRYVHQHYGSAINQFELSQRLGITPIYASQLFKKEVGVTFSDYLTQYRIKRAEELLRSGNYKIYEVSELVGYNTVQYFSKQFKKITHRNPSDY